MPNRLCSKQGHYAPFLDLSRPYAEALRILTGMVMALFLSGVT